MGKYHHQLGAGSGSIGADAIPAGALLDAGFLDNPYPLYRRLQSEAPVWVVPGTSIVVVTGYALLEEAARRVEDFSSNLKHVLYKDRRGAPARLPMYTMGLQVLATADPPFHSMHKAAAFSSAVSKRMAGMGPEIESVAGDYIDRALRRGTVEFMTTVSNPLPLQIVSQLIGFRRANLDDLLQAAFDSTSVVGGTLSRLQLWWVATRALFIFRTLTAELKAAERRDDTVMGSLRQAVDAGTFQAREAAAILHTLLSAGGESTTSLIGNAVRILAENPALQQQLRDDPALITKFLEEVLRMESPFRYQLRSVPRDTRLGDVDIPAGSTVLMFFGAGNRDPEIFDRPDEFDMSRPVRHMTFGRGIHMCIGAPLARLEARTVIRVLLEKTSSISLDPDQPPRWVESLQVRRHQRLPVRLVAR